MIQYATVAVPAAPVHAVGLEDVDRVRLDKMNKQEIGGCAMSSPGYVGTNHHDTGL